ncbi:hypothetical protein KC19_1G306700 [Ceratodon purpureus]|uniref:Uncharacterized protein n=1 Tax=Ceratodon purpureus TaxID=3225 RepID=A0A8T0JEM3_CERPU|nr:hypothetical protein KC19_1G306700 [Ceratodon purpureus]
MDWLSPESYSTYGFSTTVGVGNIVTVWTWGELDNYLRGIDDEDLEIFVEDKDGTSVNHVVEQAIASSVQSRFGRCLLAASDEAEVLFLESSVIHTNMSNIVYLPCSEWFTTQREQSVHSEVQSFSRTGRRRIFRSRPSTLCPYMDMDDIDDMPDLESDCDDQYDEPVEDMPPLENCQELQLFSDASEYYTFGPETRCHFAELVLYVTVLQFMCVLTNMPELVSPEVFQLICFFGVEEHLHRCRSRSCVLHLMSWSLLC